jgi:Ras family protein T1
VLRTFGYNDELLLDPEFLVPELEDLKPGKVVELGDGMKFFEEGFTALDKDKDGKLSGDELDMLFSTAPDGNPWRKYDYQLSNDLKEVTLAQFKALWSMTTLHSYKTTLKYLAYLGYPDHQKEAVVIKSCRKEDLIKKKLSRSVLQGYVFGAQGSGKSSVLDRLANTAPFSAPPPNTSPKRVAVNQVNTTRGHKYLTLMEFTAETEKSILSSDKEMNACDVVVLVFDATSPKSVDNISKVYDQLQTSKRNLPVIVVGTKKDSLATDEAETAAANFCKSHLLNGPLMVSMKGETADLYQQILETATQDFQPETSRGSGWGKTLGLTVVGLAIVGGIAYAGKTYLWPKVSGNNK